MRILHIAAHDLDGYRRNQLLAMAVLYKELGLEQLVLADQGAALDPLKAMGVPLQTHGFGRLFDLKGLKAAGASVESFAPNIVQCHSPHAVSHARKNLNGFSSLIVCFEDDAPQAAEGVLKLRRAYARKDRGQEDICVPPLVWPVPSPAMPDRTDDGAPVIAAMLEAADAPMLDVLFNAAREIQGARVAALIPPESGERALDMARQRKIQDRFSWIPMPAPAQAVEYLAKQDLYAALPGRHPDVFAPLAWAAGIPVLSGAAAALSPVEHERTGWVVGDGNNVMEWRRAIERLRQDTPFRRSLAEGGRAAHARLVRPENMVGPYLTAYRSVLTATV